MIEQRLKKSADDENEVLDVAAFVDPGHMVVTPVAQFAPEVALPIVEAFSAIVTRASTTKAALTPDTDGVVRAQEFEEGDVYMIEKPFDGFFADRYLMNFHNVADRGTCARMHLHTGLRYLRVMTGPDTSIRVSSLSPFELTHIEGVTPFRPHRFSDDLPDTPGVQRTRYNLIIPPCCFTDVQIPRGVSHQFNAVGPNAVIDVIHPEESVEAFREQMESLKMINQTIFLSEQLPPATSCTTSIP